MSSTDPPVPGASSAASLPITPARFAAALGDLPLGSLHLKALELRNSLAHLAYSNAQLRPFAEGTAATLDSSSSNNNNSTGGEGEELQPQQARPDPDCVDAIRENELVMARMRERLLLLRAEVERRGLSWREFEGGATTRVEGGGEEEEDNNNNNNDDEAQGAAGPGSSGGSPADAPPLTNGTGSGARGGSRGEAGGPLASASTAAGSNPWTDGTFQTGVIRNGEVRMDEVPGQSLGRAGTAAAGTSSTTATSSGPSETTATAGRSGGSGGRLTDTELRRLLEERLGEDGGDDEDGGLHL